MKAMIAQRLDTTWANAVELSLEVELDNPHALITRELLSLQVHRMRIFCEEVRAENERTILYGVGVSSELREEARRNEGVGTEFERETQSFREMERSRDDARREAEERTDRPDWAGRDRERGREPEERDRR